MRTDVLVATIVSLGLVGCSTTDGGNPSNTVIGDPSIRDYSQLTEAEKRQQDSAFTSLLESFRTCEVQEDAGRMWRSCSFGGSDSSLYFATSGPSTPARDELDKQTTFYGIRLPGLSVMHVQGDPCLSISSVFDTQWVQGWATLNLRTGDVYPGVDDADAQVACAP